MNPIRRILTATDLSGPSRHAVDRAVRLADETGARLAALHVVSQGAVDGLRRIVGEDTIRSERHSPLSIGLLSNAPLRCGLLYAGRGSRAAAAGQPGA